MQKWTPAPKEICGLGLRRRSSRFGRSKTRSSRFAEPAHRTISVSGGKSFYPTSAVEMDEIFERIAIELRNQYSIGYTPTDFQPDGKWRKVRVKVKPPRGLPRLTVRSREGYYASPAVSYK